MTPSKTALCTYFMISFYGKAQGLIPYAFSSPHWPFGVQHVWKSFLRPFSLFNSAKSLLKKPLYSGSPSTPCPWDHPKRSVIGHVFSPPASSSSRSEDSTQGSRGGSASLITPTLSGKIPSATGHRWRQKAINKHVTLQSLLFPFQPSRPGQGGYDDSGYGDEDGWDSGT